MINLILFLVAITCFGIAAAWVAENPGQVTIYWFDYRIDTSFAFLLLLAFSAALLFTFVYLFLRRLLITPKHLLQARRLRNYRRGITELTYSVAALAASDASGAEQHTRKAEKLIGRTPLTLMLSAQVARSQGDDTKTRALLEQMLEHKETEYLAARSLSDAASKQHQFPRALSLAERAYKIGPKDKNSVAAVVSLNIRLGQWQEALVAIDKAVRRGYAKKRSAILRYRGMVHLKQGMALFEQNRIEAAISHARICLKYLPGFAPAAVFAAKAYNADGQQAKAIKILFRAWKHMAHPQLGETMRKLILREPPERQARIIAKFTGLKPNERESDLTLAHFAIRQRQWENGRRNLALAITKRETVRACKLMAEVEQEGFSDSNAAGKWLTRAAAAAPDPVWVCEACAQVSEIWDAHCPSCDAFDTLGWK